MGSVVQRGRAPMGRGRATVVEVKQGQGDLRGRMPLLNEEVKLGGLPQVCSGIYT